jgi:hypothetical protein
MSRRFYMGLCGESGWGFNRGWTRGRAACPADPFFLAARLATPILAVCPFSPAIPDFTSGEGILAPGAGVAVYNKAP